MRRRTIACALSALLVFGGAFWLAGVSAQAATGDRDDPLVSKSWVDAYVDSHFSPLEQQLKQLKERLSGSSRTVVLQINSTTAYINNQAVTLDAAPELAGGYTMLPLRFIGETFGLLVAWSDSTQTVTCTGGGRTVLLHTKTGGASVDGQTVSLPAKPFVKNGRVLVPVRFVLEAFGRSVDWQGGTKTVTIK